jgi:hypothetical protein
LGRQVEVLGQRSDEQGVISYSTRPTVLITLPVQEAITPIRPEQTMIKAINSFDLGALCYLKRSSERRNKLESRKVVLTSLDSVRSKSIGRIVNNLLLLSATRELSEHSIYSRCTFFIQYLDWCDTNDHQNALNDLDAGREALRCYVRHVRQLFDTQKLKMRTVYTCQGHIAAVLNHYFGVSNIESGANFLVWNEVLAERTEAPTQDRLSKFLSLHQAIFEGICDLILHGGRYPYAVNMPSFVGYKTNQMWLFPVLTAWVKHPDSKVLESYRVFDFENGRVKNLDEVVQSYQNLDTARKAVARARLVIGEANAEARSPARIRLASLGCKIFIRIFEAVTGSNRASTLRIQWNDELASQIAKPGSERQGFRTFKVRADNKEVFYQVGVAYLPLLRKFVQLRAWLLNSEPFSSFFMHYVGPGHSASPGPKKLGKSEMGNLDKSMTQMYPGFKHIKLSNRKTRASKQDHVIRTYDPVTGSRIMQHNLSTALRNYSNGSIEVAREEMGAFLQTVHSVVAEGRHHTKVVEERALGGCVSQNDPSPVKPNPPVQPDCKRSEGCLFCDKYRAHADERDVRKLLSAKLVVEQTSTLANTAEEFDRVFGATIKRIDEVLATVRAASADMPKLIDRVTTEVAAGGLDVYWDAKLEELLEAGLL